MDTNALSARQRQAKFLRACRKVHRTTGVLLFVFFFVLATTGLLLGWKKNSGGYLLAETQKGTSTQLSNWLPLDSLSKNACRFLHEQVSPDLSLELDRIDVRPQKGVVKFVFAEHYWGVQVDGATGQLRSIERRRADFIEKIHDGSVVDQLIGLPQGYFKLFYTSLMGSALIIFTVTGFWLWYGPKRMRAK